MTQIGKWQAALFFLSVLPLWSQDVIVIGQGGEEHYEKRFNEWGGRLYKALVDICKRPKDDITVFSSGLIGEAIPHKKADLANLKALFQKLGAEKEKDKPLFLYFIGHGSYLKGEAKFQIEGPDLTAEQLAEWLAPLGGQPVVVINASSASAPFIEKLSAPQRIVATATKSAGELNATEFMEFFLQALEQGIADQNRDSRVSVWEAMRQAAGLTKTWYSGNGLIATEHALIDDNGDKEGTRLVPDENEPENERQTLTLDGDLSAQVFLKDFTFPDRAPRQLIDDYLNTVKQAEALIARKRSLNRNEYYRRLETLMLKAAGTHRKIRSYAQID